MNGTSRNIGRILLGEMKFGRYAAVDRLPRETVLSEELGISRTQLRDALADLEREGFIARRHGVGTVINRHVLAVQNRMDIETEFLDMIRQSGFTPGQAFVELDECRADSNVAEKLGIPVDTEVLCVRRLCTANGAPAIYSEDFIDKRRVYGAYDQADMLLPIFDFLRDYCGTAAVMDLTELHAVSADQTVAAALGVAQGTPLLNMEEVDFDIEGNPILYSRQYYPDGIVRQTVLRKKL